MTDTIFVIGHRSPDTDSICAAIAYAELKDKILDEEVRAARAGEINHETKFVLEYFKTDAPELLENAEDKKLILVDHNDIPHGVHGMEHADILEIIDHHQLGGITTHHPIRFNAQPVGSTSTIVAKEFNLNKTKMSRKTAGLLLSGLLSDTVMLRSPTTTDEDRETARELAEKAGLDLQEFGSRLLHAKCNIEGRSINQIVGGDLKEYHFIGDEIGISHLEIADFEDIEPLREQILQEMEKIRTDKQWTMMILMITDIMRGDSELFLVGDKLDLVEKAFGKTMRNQTLYLEGIMSRKKQVVPPLRRSLRQPRPNSHTSQQG